MPPKDRFTFEISLSVLNHLGRNLYRSFATVLGEAISNSWDANAHNVYIYINREKKSLVIKDDGGGMSKSDFQDKFLKIGYTKRKNGQMTSDEGRPFIGRKGIGKLALLSCAEVITVVSKQKSSEYVGGVIDNSGLDKAIDDDLVPKQYPLGEWDPELIKPFINEHEQGTIIVFQNIKDGIKNSLDYLKKVIALYFRFSLIDDSFNIFIDDEQITLENLNDLAAKTQFLWTINNLKDPYVADKLSGTKESKNIAFMSEVNGFIASVNKPLDLKVIGTAEKVSVDLFVNGRIREKDILKHIPTARVVESYLYGQIHYNGLDDEQIDRFTSSREGMVAEDPKYLEFLEKFKLEVLTPILDDWDQWRRKHKKEGDPENTSINSKERKSEELFNVVAEEFELPADSENKVVVAQWVDQLSEDASFNFASYAECFISENVIRKFIEEKGVVLTKQANDSIDEYRRRSANNKQTAGITIELKKVDADISYLDMDDLANLVDKGTPSSTLPNDARSYKPIRDALMHTSLLSDEAKRKLTSIYDNIKARIKVLLS